MNSTFWRAYAPLLIAVLLISPLVHAVPHGHSHALSETEQHVALHGQHDVPGSSVLIVKVNSATAPLAARKPVTFWVSRYTQGIRDGSAAHRRFG